MILDRSVIPARIWDVTSGRCGIPANIVSCQL